jgi:phosphatidate cytidylyltransferase
MGSILAAVAAAVLFGDGYLGPWYPCIYLVFVGLAFPAVRELISLRPVEDRPGRLATTLAVMAVLSSNWYTPLAEAFPQYLPRASEPWYPVLMTATGAVLAAFLIEMINYRVPGHSVPKVSNTILAIVYLGILPSFLVKLRWVRPEFAGLMLGMTIFVPKMCDIAAYFTGRAIGRTPFSPWLSPKKTWEGTIGGLLGAIVAALLLRFVSMQVRPDGQDVFRNGIWEAVLFGLVVGFAGILGDLAESLIKRDSQAKDASKSVPGFGGVLDVIDSVLFAAPVAYIWFSW